MQKIKILYLISALKKCGPISVLYNIIRGLDPKTYEIFVLSLSEREAGPIHNQFKELQIEFISLNETELCFVN